MKKVALAAALSLAATSAFAGGFVEPVMEPEVIIEETAGTSGGIVVPLLLLAVVAAVAMSD
jgi:hypothetical protein